MKQKKSIVERRRSHTVTHTVTRTFFFCKKPQIGVGIFPAQCLINPNLVFVCRSQLISKSEQSIGFTPRMRFSLGVFSLVVVTLVVPIFFSIWRARRRTGTDEAHLIVIWLALLVLVLQFSSVTLTHSLMMTGDPSEGNKVYKFLDSYFDL